jgi:multidrug efflux system membrane fusion protein
MISPVQEKVAAGFSLRRCGQKIQGDYLYLVPKLRLGTGFFSELGFEGQAQLGPKARSQAQLGNEKNKSPFSKGGFRGILRAGCGLVFPLVPKLRLGTHLPSKLRFEGGQAQLGPHAPSPAQLGNEERKSVYSQKFSNMKQSLVARASSLCRGRLKPAATTFSGSALSFKFLAAALGLLLWAVLAGGCGKEEKVEKPPTPVSVKAAEEYRGGGETRYSANIQPYSRIEMAFKSGGYLVGIFQVRGVDGRMRNLQEGDYVKKGTVLAQVRKSDYQAKVSQAASQLAAARAALTHADLDFGRARNLYAANSMTKSDYDKAQAQYGQALGSVGAAAAQVQEAKIALQDASLKAPVHSLVLKRRVEVGDLVSASTAGFSLANTEDVKVVFGVSDLMLQHLKLGEAMAVTTEALRSKEFRGLVTSISPSADPKSRVFDVEITIPNPQQELKVGMIAAVAVATGLAPQAVTAVALTAIVRSKAKPEGYALFVVEEKDGKKIASFRDNVELGEVYGNMIAVTKGVKVGEPVIVTGATLVTDGQPVRVIPPPER